VILSTLLLGCNVNDKKFSKSFKFDNEINFVLPTDGFESCLDFVNSLNLIENELFKDIDYSSQYFTCENFYFFQYENMNIIMKNLDDYICLQNPNQKITLEDVRNIKLNKDTIFDIIDKFGFPVVETGSGQTYYEYHIIEEDFIISFRISCQFSSSDFGSVIVTYVSVDKRWY
jgi:hypothetical protein